MSRGATLVEVTTDEGLTGWGEALCQGLQPPEIAAAAITSALRPLILGADPLEPEVLWHRMYHHVKLVAQVRDAELQDLAHFLRHFRR